MDATGQSNEDTNATRDLERRKKEEEERRKKEEEEQRKKEEDARPT